ncbi:MAG: hypothetical protein MI810_02850, partial [Flavobacteriales bacterium]|nr:hypothetical protein [Flavobacteriales bacterium]
MNDLKEIRNRFGRGEAPEADLTLKTDELFYERLYYKEKIYPTSDIPSQNFWYLKPFYGLINRKSEPIYPTESALKQFKSSDTLLAINFVVDAFEDLKDFIIRAGTLGQIDTIATPYANIEPVRAWTSIHQSYHLLMEIHYDQFYTEWSTRKSRNLKINSFQQFVEQFMEYLLKVVHQVPFTRSQFVTSPIGSPYVSGLVIEIKDLNDNNDKPKK